MKKVTFSVILFSFLLLNIQHVRCQIFLIGTDPASVKWNQIRTPNFRVIYPRVLEDKGQYVANALEYYYLHGGQSLNTLAARTPVILHPYTTVPSSVTYIAPRRMEFFTTPPQDIYPQDWTDQLVIHEFRHAVQYSALNRGFTRGLSYILGEQATLAIFGLYLPLWFVEGDATVTETANHTTGRGRTPSFEMKLRAQVVDRGIYSYEKACYGSYRDFVPGKYEMGYQLVGWSRVLYGKDLWAGVMSNVGKKPYTLTAFSSPLRRETGLNKYTLYDTVTTLLRTGWANEDRIVKETDYTLIEGRRNSFYTSYNLPVVFRDSLVVAVRSSPDFLTDVVVLNRKGEEKRLFRTGANYYSESLSAGDSMIYWSELVTDPRWFLRDYRVIKSYNFNSGKVSQLTRRTRYFAPVISHNGRLMAAVEADAANRYSLVILDPADGSLKKKITTPENFLFIHPSWSENDSLIVSVVFGKEGNSLALTSPQTGSTRVLLPFTSREMKRPSFSGGKIYYTASYDGKDNIYALDTVSGDILRITSSRFGSCDAFLPAGGKEMIYSYYTSDGYRIAAAPASPATGEKFSLPPVSPFTLAEKLTQQEGFIFNSDSVPGISLESEPYSKLLNKVNIHSWAPVGIDLQNVAPSLGVTLFSQNLLETTLLSAGYVYNLNERTGRFFMNINDESRYIAFDLGLDYGSRRDTGIYTDNETIPEKWNELNITPGLRLPLFWTKGPWLRRFEAGAKMNFKFLRMDESVPVVFEDERIIAPGYSLLLSNELKSSYRDIFPGWSQEIRFDFSNTPFGAGYNSIMAFQAELLIPGFVKHHSIRLYGAYQKKEAGTYPFQDLIIYPRGYSGISLSRSASYSAQYSLPLFYPEWRIKSVLYLKRIKASLFYDYAESVSDAEPGYYSAAGIDLTGDFNLFNLMIPLDAGFRTLYFPGENSIGFGLLFSLNFGAMY